MYTINVSNKLYSVHILLSLHIYLWLKHSVISNKTCRHTVHCDAQLWFFKSGLNNGLIVRYDANPIFKKIKANIDQCSPLALLLFGGHQLAQFKQRISLRYWKVVGIWRKKHHDIRTKQLRN